MFLQLQCEGGKDKLKLCSRIPEADAAGVWPQERLADKRHSRQCGSVTGGSLLQEQRLHLDMVEICLDDFTIIALIESVCKK